MQILLPIAGLGTRVRPHTHVRPKPMLSLAGKPILGHILDQLLPLKPSSVILVVGDRAEPIERYVSANYDVPVHVRRQVNPQGQSHAIWMAKDVIEEPLLIVFGDTLFETDTAAMLDGSVDGSIIVHPVDDARRFGVVELREGLITGLIEKPEEPPTNLAVIGVYMINDHRGLLDAIDRQMQSGDALKGEFFLAGALQRMIDGGSRLKPVVATGWWDTGTIDAVLDAHRYLVEQHPSRPAQSSTARIVEPCCIDPSAVLERCVVGPYVTIGAGSRVSDCVISDAIIGDKATVSCQVIHRSVIGSDVTVQGQPLSFNIADHSAIQTVESNG